MVEVDAVITANRRKRLIEVAFPLEEVSAHSRREKNVRHGHISTLHIWWARRPLAACRAFIYASLVDDPQTDAEREELLKEVADLASWDAVRHPDRVVRPKEDGGTGLTGTELLKRARRRILDCNGGRPPKLLDPFAGGGAIPLEGLRLGCEVEASDLNPVAVLILKGTVEYPQKFGQPNSRPVPDYILKANDDGSQSSFTDGDLAEAYRRNPLATDVRYWGNWMLERAREELAEFYPPDPDGSVPIAYLWSRTIPCPNCGAEMPLIRQYWLARKPKKRVALKPVPNWDKNRVDFEVVKGSDVTGNPAEATTSRGDTKCLLCGQVVKADQVKLAGQEGKMSAVLTSVVTAQEKGRKSYRKDCEADWASLQTAYAALDKLEKRHSGDLSLVPDEPLAEDPRNVWCYQYGLDTFGKLFNVRQLLAITTFSRLVADAHAEMLREGLGAEYARAVAMYLGFAVDRQATRTSTGSFWDAGGETVQQLLARQALPFVWDYVESAPLEKASGGFSTNIETLADAVTQQSFASSPGRVLARDARRPSSDPHQSIVTDPPYYDSINYADLSDFFYVWLKRSVGFLYDEVLELPLTPKRDQIVMNVHGVEAAGRGKRRDRAKRQYIQGMALASKAMAESLETEVEVFSPRLKGIAVNAKEFFDEKSTEGSESGRQSHVSV